MKVLLTNDDGILAPGLKAVFNALKKRGHKVQVVAPIRQQSGTAHSVTVFSPLLVEKVTEGDLTGTGVYGTPADCVKLGLGPLSIFKPDVVISGINQGPNAGPDIHYSGTVGAAAEAAQASVPAIALSRLNFEIGDDLEEIANHAIELAEKLNWAETGKNSLLNINYPREPFNSKMEIKVCPQSLVNWPNEYSERKDPRNNSYWWFASELDPEKFEPGSDRDLLAKGYITITPLKFDYTDYARLEKLRELF